MAVFVWAVGSGQSADVLIGLFDTNQWYQAQMPSSVRWKKSVKYTGYVDICCLSRETIYLSLTFSPSPLFVYLSLSLHCSLSFALPSFNLFLPSTSPLISLPLSPTTVCSDVPTSLSTHSREW